MSKYDPTIPQEARVRMRGWQDGDISLVNGTVRVFDAETMKWPEVERNSLPFDLPTDPNYQGTWRADGTAYRERGIISEDFASIGRFSAFAKRGPDKLENLRSRKEPKPISSPGRSARPCWKRW